MSNGNSNNKRKIISILLIITIAISGGIGLTAYSMYKSQIQQAMKAQIAKWSFKVYSGTGENRKEITQEISLADSRTDGKEEQVAKGKIAPGTNGEFILEIDGSGSEIAIDYEVSIDTSNKPTNLKFYTDNTYTTPMELLDGKMTASGGIELNEVNIPKQIVIYWKWDFETKTKVEKIQNGTEKMLNSLQNLAQKKQITPETAYESYKTENGITDELTIEQKIEAILEQLNNQADTEAKIIEINDVIDTAESGTKTSMKITVIGEQRDSNEKDLAQGNIEIVAPTSGIYSAGEVVTIKANYTDKIYGAPNRVAVTKQTAPVLKIKFGTGNAQETTFSGVGTDGKSLLYTYVVKEDDNGSLEVDSYTGNVYSKRDVVLAVETKMLSGEDITAESAKKLADVVQVGDYVEYNAGTQSTSTTGYDGTTLSGTLSANQVTKWRVLSKNEVTGEVNLVAADPTSTKMTLTGINGYKNAELALNKVCNEVYGKGEGAQSARSINIDDVMQYSNFNPKTQYSNSYSSTGTVGGTKKYTSGTFIKGETYNDNGTIKEVVTGGTDKENGTVTAGVFKPVTVIQTYYHTDSESITKTSFTEKDSTNGEKIYNMLFKTSTNTSSNKPEYWLASRCVRLWSNYCDLHVRRVSLGHVSDSMVYHTNGNVEISASVLMPVVSLKSNIRTSGQNSSGEWQLK